MSWDKGVLAVGRGQGGGLGDPRGFLAEGSGGVCVCVSRGWGGSHLDSWLCRFSTESTVQGNTRRLCRWDSPGGARGT